MGLEVGFGVGTSLMLVSDVFDVGVVVVELGLQVLRVLGAFGASRLVASVVDLEIASGRTRRCYHVRKRELSWGTE